MSDLTTDELVDYPMFPLSTPLLPGTALPMQIFEPRYLEMMRRQLGDPDRSTPEFGVVMIERGTETGGDDDRATVACRALAAQLEVAPSGIIRFVAVGVERLRVVRWLADDPFPRAEVETWPDLPGPPVDAARLDVIGELIRELSSIASELGEPFPAQMNSAELNADYFASEYGLFQVAAATGLSTLDRFRVLAAPSIDERVVALTGALEDALSVLKFRQIC